MKIHLLHSKNSAFYYLLAAAILFILILAAGWYLSLHDQPRNITKKFQHEFLNQELRLEHFLENSFQNPDTKNPAETFQAQNADRNAGTKTVVPDSDTQKALKKSETKYPAEDFKSKNTDRTNETKNAVQSSDTKNSGENSDSSAAGRNRRNFFNGELQSPQPFFIHLIFDHESLIGWNDNRVEAGTWIAQIPAGTPVVRKMPNGWYYWRTTAERGLIHAGGFLIKREFSIENDYLRNDFEPWSGLPDGTGITLTPTPYPVQSRTGTTLFYLEFKDPATPSATVSSIIFALLIAAYVFIALFLYQFYRHHEWFKTRNYVLFICFLVDFLTVRIFQFYTHFPGILNDTPLFSPVLFSSSALLPSLGDFLLNAMAVVVLGLVFNRSFTLSGAARNLSTSWKLTLIATILSVVLMLTVALRGLTGNLVLNSSFSLKLQDISGFTSESALGIGILLMLFLSYWLITSRLITESLKLFPGNDPAASRGSNWQIPVVALLISILGALLLNLCQDGDTITLAGPFFVYVILFWLFDISGKQFFSVPRILILLAFFAFFGTIVLNTANDRKTKAKTDLLVAKIAAWKNPATEIMFEEVTATITGDSIFWHARLPGLEAGSNDPDSLTSHIREHFFKGYWDRFNIQVTLCDSAKMLNILPQGTIVRCEEYFGNIIRTYGEETGIPGFFTLDYGFGKENYVAVFNSLNLRGADPRRNFSLFIEISLNRVGSDPGFPGILIADRNESVFVPDDISYGVYRNRYLVHSVGRYQYPLELQATQMEEGRVAPAPGSDMNHTFYRIDPDTVLLISTRKTTLFGWITPFSYLFILFALVALLVVLLMRIAKGSRVFPDTLRNRLYVVLIGILLQTLLVSGWIQIRNIISVNSQKDTDNLRERAASIGVEVQHKFGSVGLPEQVSPGALDDFLVKLSNVFFTDINFYSPDGFLLSTSRHKLFSEGIQSTRMNPAAFSVMMHEMRPIFIHRESIGEMEFLSAYMPLLNTSNTLLGYINLPYFSKGEEPKREIAAFMVTFLNIYILLFIFGILVTIFISNHITSPLALLGNRLSRIRLDQSNEKIPWNKKDEIGQLVKEYNRMVDELERSAGMLARSERETAWRDMARQVAHEIKNPLTPIRLSAQHLEKAWNEKAPDLDQRLRRFLQTLILQIDALSEIATNFSDFAKLPRMKLEKVDVEDVSRFVIALYRDALSIRFELIAADSGFVVTADRSQLVRVFTNLISNAIQAIGENVNGQITITLRKEPGFVLTDIADNGMGISADKVSRVFKPGFTTKPGGMGLGLAIVKAILDDMNAEITLESTGPQGTRFRIKIPVNQPAENHYKSDGKAV